MLNQAQTEYRTSEGFLPNNQKNSVEGSLGDYTNFEYNTIIKSNNLKRSKYIYFIVNETEK